MKGHDFATMIAAAKVMPNATAIMSNINDVLIEHLDELEVIDKYAHKELLVDVYIAIYGPHFNEACATHAVGMMMNEDGTNGQHWSYADTTSVARGIGITFTSYNEWDWYYVMNMLYSDFYKVLGTDPTMYANLSKAYLEDKDVPEGKAYFYYIDVVKTLY